MHVSVPSNDVYLLLSMNGLIDLVKKNMTDMAPSNGTSAKEVSALWKEH